MIDVKKLITGFLVLAVAAGAGALIISNIGASIATNQTAIVATAVTAPSSPVSGNAFLPQTAAQAAATLAADDATANNAALASTTDAVMSDPNNLTNQLEETYMTDLMSTNPSGPTTDTSGAQNLAAPDSATVIAEFENNASSSVNTPDWNAEAAEVPIITMATSSPEAIANYSSAIQNIFTQDFVQTNAEAMLNNNTDPSAGAYVEPEIQSALQDIAGLQTPTPLVAFQKSLIKVLVYQKNTLQLAESVTSSTDPLKIALILQNETSNYNAAAAAFESAAENAAALTGFAPIAVNNTSAPAVATTTPQSAVTSFVNSVLGVKTAYAFLGLGDITFDPTAFGQMLINYANDIILQILKNLIIATMQKTVLKWVQGNGVPKFIQNWGTTLVNAYTQSAIGALNSQMSCITNAPFAAQVKLTLGATYPSGNTNVCAVSFQNALNSGKGGLTAFYNNFSNGGWLTYGSTLQPDNNYYGATFFTAQAVANTAQNAQNAAQAKAIANQGWTGEELCSGQSGGALSVDAGTGCHPGDVLNASGQCLPTTGPAYAPQGGGGQCADGSAPQVVQPGQVVGQVFNSAVDSGGNLTTGANDVAGLLDSFLSSLLNSLASNLVTTATGALTNLGSNPNDGGQGGSIPLSCTATVQSNNGDMVTFIGAGGQGVSVTNTQLGTTPPTVNTSQPAYSWSVTNSQGAVVTSQAGVGQFTYTFNASGTYYATLTNTNNGSTGQCSISVP